MTEEQVDQQILELQRRARTAVDAGALLVQLGNLCLRHHRLDEALSAFRQVIDSGRGSAVLRFNYGWFAKQAGRPHLALDQYAKALALGIKQPEEVHLNRANVYSELLLDSTSALKELEAALKLNPGYFPAWLNLGNLYEQMGQVNESRAAFMRALEIDPSSSSALARLAL
jgi:tetratricopeptide (TPR) repeat protein